jgi:hypothetical protein
MTREENGRRGQRGMGTIQMLLLVVVVAVVAFVALKAGGAWLDVSGFRKDLEENITEMQYNCLGAGCEEEFLGELEQLRKDKGRDVQIDWENLDWLGAENTVVVKGWKVVDFRVWKYTYYFTIEVPVHK